VATSPTIGFSNAYPHSGAQWPQNSCSPSRILPLPLSDFEDDHSNAACKLGTNSSEFREDYVRLGSVSFFPFDFERLRAL